MAQSVNPSSANELGGAHELAKCELANFELARLRTRATLRSGAAISLALSPPLSFCSAHRRHGRRMKVPARRRPITCCKPRASTARSAAGCARRPQRPPLATLRSSARAPRKCASRWKRRSPRRSPQFRPGRMPEASAGTGAILPVVVKTVREMAEPEADTPLVHANELSDLDMAAKPLSAEPL